MLDIAKINPNFDYDKFFREYVLQNVQVFSSSYMSQAILDPHPLGYLRNNAVVQQVQEFYDTYDIQPGDGMYLAPEERTNVW